MSAPIALLRRERGTLTARAPLDPCDACEDQACELGHGCPTYAAGDDPCDFGDPGAADPDYRECWPEPVQWLTA